MARILVIEDESDIRQVLDYNLRLAGHEVLAAARARKGCGWRASSIPTWSCSI